MDLIPLPRSIITSEGVFSIDNSTTIILEPEHNYRDFDTAKLFQKKIKNIIAIEPEIKKAGNKTRDNYENSICFEYNKQYKNEEAYGIHISTKQIIISAGSHNGLFYGVATLIQLCQTTKGEIGCLDIEDEPSYRYRGYMLDVSRGRIPKMSSLKELVDKLAFYKINQLQLYMENSLKLDGFEEIWSKTDPFLPEEMLELDRYCFKRNIELVPCVATFGHLYDLLCSDSYCKYREIDDENASVFTWQNRLRYHTINVTDPGSVPLIKGILDQYLPLFNSNKININCDETFDLGKGKSASLAKELTFGKLYINYVNQLVEYLQSKGKEVMIWGDILKKYPGTIEELNPKAICLNWHYDYGAPEDVIKTCADKGRKQYVCPSAAGYNSLVNEYDLSFANIKEMAEAGMKHQVEGFINTDWGDYGHINMPALSLPCIIYGAAKSWNTEDNRDIPNMDQTISFIEYGDKSRSLMNLLRDLSQQDIITFGDIVCFRDYKIHNHTHTSNGIVMHEELKDKMLKITEDQLKSAIHRCSIIIQDIKKNEALSCIELQQEIFEYYLSARGVSLIQELALIIKKQEYGQDVSPLSDSNELARKLEDWLMDYCQDWRKVSRVSELYNIREFIWQISSILRKYKQKDNN